MATIEVEHEICSIPFNDKLPATLDALGKEGWQLIPGVQPVVIYHMVRVKGASANTGKLFTKVEAHIDEEKVQILRNGKLLDYEEEVNQPTPSS